MESAAAMPAKSARISRAATFGSLRSRVRRMRMSRVTMLASLIFCGHWFCSLILLQKQKSAYLPLTETFPGDYNNHIDIQPLHSEALHVIQNHRHQGGKG